MVLTLRSCRVNSGRESQKHLHFYLYLKENTIIQMYIFFSAKMETPTASTDLNNLDAIPIDEQQLYDWGIEHRLDQYYGNPDQAPNQYPYPTQQNNNKATIGYILPEHVQNQENAYLVTINSDDPKQSKVGPNLPGNPVPPLKMDKKYHKNIRPNGVPGRRPILPTVDMDANELLKVNMSLNYPKMV